MYCLNALETVWSCALKVLTNDFTCYRICELLSAYVCGCGIKKNLEVSHSYGMFNTWTNLSDRENSWSLIV